MNRMLNVLFTKGIWLEIFFLVAYILYYLPSNRPFAWDSYPLVVFMVGLIILDSVSSFRFKNLMKRCKFIWFLGMIVASIYFIAQGTRSFDFIMIGSGILLILYLALRVVKDFCIMYQKNQDDLIFDGDE